MSVFYDGKVIYGGMERGFLFFEEILMKVWCSDGILYKINFFWRVEALEKDYKYLK